MSRGIEGADVQLSFGNYVLDIERRELMLGSELISLGPQVFDLLVYLVGNRERVVSKDDLFGCSLGSGSSLNQP